MVGVANLVERCTRLEAKMHGWRLRFRNATPMRVGATLVDLRKCGDVAIAELEMDCEAQKCFEEWIRIAR